MLIQETKRIVWPIGRATSLNAVHPCLVLCCAMHVPSSSSASAFPEQQLLLWAAYLNATRALKPGHRPSVRWGRAVQLTVHPSSDAGLACAVPLVGRWLCSCRSTLLWLVKELAPSAIHCPVLVQVAVHCLHDPGPAVCGHALHAGQGWLGLDQHGWEQLTGNGQPGSPQVCYWLANYIAVTLLIRAKKPECSAVGSASVLGTCDVKTKQ